MKKLFIFFMVSVLALVLVGCVKPEKVEYSVEIEAEVTTVKVGETISVYATTNHESRDYVWTSSDDSIATVNEVGMVNGVNAGVVTIKVTVKDADNKDVAEDEIEITVIDRDVTAAELKAYLNDVLTTYTNTKNGSIKVSGNDGTFSMTSETIFNYENDSIVSLMYNVKFNGEETHAYVKDGYSYTLSNGAKFKKQLTEQEKTTIKNNYNHVDFLEPVTAFYNEQAFYDALKFDKKTGDTLAFLLDLAAYKGNTFATQGVDEVKILVTLTNDKVVKVEVATKEGSVNQNVVVEYRGTGVQTINYPADLESYGK